MDRTLLCSEQSTETVLDGAFESVGVERACSADEFEDAAETVARSGTESVGRFDYLARVFRVAAADDDGDVDREVGATAGGAGDAEGGVDATALARAYDAALDHAGVSTVPGAEVVHELGADYALGAITNGRERTHAVKLSAAGLADAFDAVVYGDDADHVKPHPEPFELALAELDAAPERTLKVGDSLRKDVRGANELGLTSVWIPNGTGSRDGSDPEPDHRLDSLADLPDLL